MRVSKKKSWSQREFSIGPEQHSGKGAALLAPEHRKLLIHASKTSLSAALCWWLAQRFGWSEGYWGAISAIIVLQSNFGATVTASRDRLIGTLLGAAFGFFFSSFGTLPWNYILAVMSAVIVCGLLGLRASSRLAGVTVTIVMLVQKASHWSVALNRVAEVLLGIVVAVLVSTFVFPDRARIRLRDGLAHEFVLLGALFEGSLQGFRSQPPANLYDLRENVLTAIRGNNQLLEAARHEPAGGPGWREGLSMLSQFGRSIFDSLIALEFSVRDSNRDAYAQQLEPELGQLVADILTGFHYVAQCINRWTFHIPPPNLDLEGDIARLEARMAAIRHTGVQYAQAEILRAYAMQLHLKQLALLLRASRVETSDAIGEARGV